MATQLPIVGQYHKLPAPTLIKVLPFKTPLTMRPEPQNPVDNHAKAIILLTKDIPDAAFVALDDGRLKKYNLTIKDIMAKDEWQLGYIPAIAASHPKIVEIKSEIIGRLTFGEKNMAIFEFERPNS